MKTTTLSNGVVVENVGDEPTTQPLRFAVLRDGTTTQTPSEFSVPVKQWVTIPGSTIDALIRDPASMAGPETDAGLWDRVNRSLQAANLGWCGKFDLYDHDTLEDYMNDCLPDVIRTLVNRAQEPKWRDTVAVCQIGEPRRRRWAVRMCASNGDVVDLGPDGSWTTSAYYFSSESAAREALAKAKFPGAK
jgi:hypothetical protein